MYCILYHINERGSSNLQCVSCTASQAFQSSVTNASNKLRWVFQVTLHSLDLLLVMRTTCQWITFFRNCLCRGTNEKFLALRAWVWFVNLKWSPTASATFFPIRPPSYGHRSESTYCYRLAPAVFPSLQIHTPTRHPVLVSRFLKSSTLSSMEYQSSPNIYQNNGCRHFPSDSYIHRIIVYISAFSGWPSSWRLLLTTLGRLVPSSFATRAILSVSVPVQY